MSELPKIRIGTAGWSIPRASAAWLPGTGTHLERYARLLRCAEINSSFHRPHAAATYAKWREHTPADFRFAVKMPRAITHDLKLQNSRALLTAFLDETSGLGDKRGPILVQLPPSFAFDATVVVPFLDLARAMYEGPLVCEPRHATWFSTPVASVLDRYRVSRVAADPPPVPAAAVPSGWPAVTYFRFHGSPRKYWSRYSHDDIAALATTLRGLPGSGQVWCVFDNTASGSAIENARELSLQLQVSGDLPAFVERDGH